MITQSFYNSTALASIKDDWETPQSLFDNLDKEFHFTLDAAAFAGNNKCEDFFSPTRSAFTHEWYGRVFLNPPSSINMKTWLHRLYTQLKHVGLIVGLFASRTDTEWWHSYVMKYAYEVRLIKGRLRFEWAGQAMPVLPFPSAICVFDPQRIHQDFRTQFYPADKLGNKI